MNGGFAPVYTREASAFAGAFCMKSGHLWGTERCLKNGRTQEIRPQGRNGGTVVRYLSGGHGGERKALHAGVLPPQHPMPHPASAGRVRGGGTCLTVQPPKTENSERWIPIPKEMLRMLKPETKQPDSYLLTGGEIVPDPRAMQYRYKVLLERCGVRYRNFHCLRHSYATRCVERGGGREKRQRTAGPRRCPHHASAIRPLVYGLQAQSRGRDRLSQGNNVKKDAERRPLSKKWHKHFRKVTYFAKTSQFQPNNSIYQPFFRVNNEF